MDQNPNVKFLYRTMQERGPNKRRVKPVAPELIQTNFEGFDDSEDDSDFDIGKLSSAGDSKSQAKETSGASTSKRGMWDTGSDDDDDDDEDDEDESDEDDDDTMSDEEEDDNDSIDIKLNETARTTTTKSNIVKKDTGQELDADVESMVDSDDDDDMESGVDDDDETTDCSDDDEDDDDDEEEDGDNWDEKNASSQEVDRGDEGLISPPIKSLENIWNSIDSDEDDEDYVPRKKRKKKESKVTVTAGAAKGAKSGNKRKQKPSPSSLSATNVLGKDDTKNPTAMADQQQQKAQQKKIKVVVCCVCLSDKSSEEEELVECDSCGISVHEGCYGIGESHSVASTESSASTEPWFCDACKANAKPICGLCPNSGGVFKETDNGKWVHLVCALYTPGVAFGDVDKLSHVTLFEMSYAKWGARECILCEDPRFSQTGVCVNCDAGMCKAYFHVTCAQREGLLAELSPDDVMEVADPFFAYCKLHADKYLSKMKRRNWLAVQSHTKSYSPSWPITDEKERARFQRKLAHHREKYAVAKVKRPPAWVPTQKMVRHLHTSPSALKGFLRKATLMGVLTQVQNTPMENKELKKPAPGSVSFTSDFISYFMDRNVKVDSLKEALGELESQNKRLQSQEKVVRQKYEKVNSLVSGLKQVSNKIRMEGESLCGMLADIYGKAVPNIPQVFMGKKNRGGSKKDFAGNQPNQLIQQCDVCKSTSNQHLLADCDSCLKHYHLGCLDPPLTRMPKKTKLFGWQCSFCVKSSSEGSVKSHPDVNQPRRLRETIKGPDKFFLLSHVQASLTSQRKKSIQSKRSKKRHKAGKKRLNAGQEDPKWKVTSPSNPSSFVKSSPPSKTSKGQPKGGQGGGAGKSSALASAHGTTATDHHISTLQMPSLEDLVDLDIICVVCNKEGQITNTVRCDDCMLSYHLQCLSPPMKKSPKVRGYAWHCEACDMSDSVIG